MRAFSSLRRFFSDTKGNIAIIFTLAVVPVMGAMGVAVDYSLANASRTALQASLDNTGLMLAKMMPLSDTDLNTRGWQIFQGNLGQSPLVFQQSDLVITQTTTTLQLDITTTYNTQLASILKLVGASTSFPVGAHAQVSWGNSRLRVTLVLDNTLSMLQSSKITALKTAANNLVTQLQGVATNNGDVYISIVPFAVAVNAGSSNYNASWIDWYEWEHDPNNVSKGTCSVSTYNGTSQSTCTSHGTCSVAGYTTQSTCTAAGTCSVSGRTSQSTCGTCSVGSSTSQSTCQAAGTCSISGFTSQSTCTSAHHCSVGTWSTQSQCQTHGGTWLAGVWTSATWTAGTWTSATWTGATWTYDHSQWTGCVGDRGTPVGYSGYTSPGTTSGSDQDLSAPSASMQPNPATAPDSSKFPAEDSAAQPTGRYPASDCPQQAMGLSYSWTALHNLINNMTPAGTTNQGIGLVWGWMSLAGGGPFTVPAMDPNYTYNQVIILLSDGLNTENRWDGAYSYTESPAVNYRMYNTAGATPAGTCVNIKNAGFTVYTVQVDTDGAGQSAILQNCASDPSKFFMLTSSNQIITTFQQIGNALANLHLSQ